MEILIPATTSHRWRSILAGREVLKKGLGWTIGEGSKVRVWDDPWLSTISPHTPIGPPTKDNAKLRVSELFHPGTNNWNLQAIRNHRKIF